MTLVIVERACPFGGQTHPVGSEIELPPESAKRLSKTSPPFVRIVSQAQLDKLTRPDKPKPKSRTGKKVKAEKGKSDAKTDT